MVTLESDRPGRFLLKRNGDVIGAIWVFAGKYWNYALHRTAGGEPVGSGSYLWKETDTLEKARGDLTAAAFEFAGEMAIWEGA